MKNRNTMFTMVLLALGSLALLARAQAVVPAPDGSYSGGNTAEGQNALLSLTTGTYNTAVGLFSLRSTTEGNFNTGIGAGALLANTGDQNTATGAGALLRDPGARIWGSVPLSVFKLSRMPRPATPTAHLVIMRSLPMPTARSTAPSATARWL